MRIANWKFKFLVIFRKDQTQPVMEGSVGGKIKRIIKRIVLIVILLGVGVLAYLYWGKFESGYKSGKILGVSEKGILFKTYEGKLNVDAFGTLKGVSPIAEVYDFSVEKSDTELLKELEEVALSGEHVNLHFIKRYIAFPWRGDTKVFATKVERLGK